MTEKKMGRPPIEIDWEEFDKLCSLQCTQEEIAGWFGCTIETIRIKLRDKFGLTFLEYFEQKRGKGKVSLRRAQFKTAVGGNPAMLIWLGKQYLGQTDKSDIVHSGNVDAIAANVEKLIVDDE